MMKNIIDYLKNTYKRLTTVGVWESPYDAAVFTGLVVFMVTTVTNMLAFTIASKAIGDKVTLLVGNMESDQRALFFFFVLNIIFTTIVITYLIVSLYDKIINRPVSELKGKLRDMAGNELSEYLTTGKLSNPFRDVSKSITWQDQVKFYVDTASAEKYIDELTGCFNKKYLVQKFTDIMQTQLIAHANNGKNSVKTYGTEIYAVFMIDIDHFKKVNDDFGHNAGDAVLRQVGKTLREIIGDRGVVIRNGGEEFVAVVAAAYPFDFSVIANDINETFRNNISVRSPLDGTYRRITSSVGFVTFPLFEDYEDKLNLQNHIELSDMAMYISKTHGRDQWNEIKMAKTPPDKIDINALCGNPEYGLKRGLFVIRNKTGEYNNTDDIKVFADK